MVTQAVRTEYGIDEEDAPAFDEGEIEKLDGTAGTGETNSGFGKISGDYKRGESEGCRARPYVIPILFEVLYLKN